VGVHDRGEFEGQIWISMDYVEGTDAARLLRERYRDGMPKSEVAAIVTAVADALDYAHQRNLLHRDVKPANILLAHPDSGDQRILLADFGIARWANEISGLTATNMTVGTVSYAAPEQLMGEQLDGRADQYALAATAFHLLTGSPPFEHSNPAVVISQHLSAPPPAIGSRRQELAELDPVLAKALSKDPKDRFERCADFARALGHRLAATTSGEGGGTSMAPVVTPQESERRSLLRACVLVQAILGVLLVAAIAVAVIVFRRADSPEATPTAKSPTLTTPTVTPMPPPPVPPPSTTTTTTPPPAAPSAAVIGADCSPVGSTATTEDGATAYCSTLQTTGASIWSLNQGDIPSPTVTAAPNEEPLPFLEESPVRVCMQQTGQTRRECRNDIRESNGLPPLP
jgi:serine/threonine-protein kinase